MFSFLYKNINVINHHALCMMVKRMEISITFFALFFIHKETTNQITNLLVTQLINLYLKFVYMFKHIFIRGVGTLLFENKIKPGFKQEHTLEIDHFFTF